MRDRRVGDRPVEFRLDLRRRPDDERLRGHFSFFRDDAASADDGTLADGGVVQHDSIHTYESIALHSTGVDDGAVADGHVGFQHSVLVQDRIVLDVRALADDDLAVITTQCGVGPDTRVGLDDDVADDDGGLVDVGGVSDLWFESIDCANYTYPSAYTDLKRPNRCGVSQAPA